MNVCPDCKAAIPVEEINVAKDVAFCRACNKAFALSSLVHGAVVPVGVDFATPPPGAWYWDNGVEVVIGATTKSLGTGIFFLFFTTFWNSITWTFVIGALGGFFKNAPSQGSGSGSSNQPPEFILLFMVPFVLVGIATAIAAGFCFIGRVETRLRGTEGTAFVGIGTLGWRKQFNASEVTDVTIDAATWQQNNRVVYQIVLRGPDIRFGGGLSEERRKFVAAALRRQIKP